MMQGISNYISEVVRGKKIRVGGKTAQWKKVKKIKVGQKIAVLSADSKSIEWEEIVEINKMGREQVWDIEVEGTHNFVAGHCVDAKTGESLTKEEEKQYLEDLKQQKTSLSADSFGAQQQDVTPAASTSLGGSTLMRGSYLSSNFNAITKNSSCQEQESGGKGNWTPGTVLERQDPHQATPTDLLLQSKINNSRWKNKDIVFGGILAHNTYAAIFNGGTVGVGTTAPAYKIDVQDSQAATVSAQIFNTNTGADADGLQIRLGINDNASLTNRFMTFVTGSGARQQMVGSITGNGSGGITLNSPGTDFAEWFDAAGNSSDYKEGDLMCLGGDGKAELCGVASSNILGIISSRYTVLGGTPGPNKVIIGLVGQLPVKIDENSPTIEAGDLVTAAPQSGTGTKLQGAGYAVGRAMESSTGKTQIMVKLEVGYHQTSEYIAKLDSLVNSKSQIPNSNEISNLNDQTSSASGSLTMKQPASPSLGGFNNLTMKSATVSGNLAVLGDTTLTDLTVTGRSSFGLLDIDGMVSSVNSLGGPLAFQTNALDKIEFEGGKIVMDEKGNIVTTGEVTASKFNVKSMDNSATSAGNAAIPAGQTTVTVQTTALTNNSLIFVSAVGDPVPVSAEKTGLDKFQIKIDNKSGTPIKVNWWIIN